MSDYYNTKALLLSTHWGRNKIAAISQRHFQIFFPEWKMYRFRQKFHVPNGPINNIPSLFQIMVWRRTGNKPLSEPMMVGLLTHICVTRPQWVINKSSLIPVTLIQTSEKEDYDVPVLVIQHGFQLDMPNFIIINFTFFIYVTRHLQSKPCFRLFCMY